MDTKTNRKLTLNKETLSDLDMDAASGGVFIRLTTITKFTWNCCTFQCGEPTYTQPTNPDPLPETVALRGF